jgi:hypothetical protein
MREITLREHLRKAGKIGGRVKSEKKRQAVVENLKKARQARWEKNREGNNCPQL